MICYHKKFIRILECWADEEPEVHRVDLLRFFQQSHPRDGMFCRDFYTILIDLKTNQDALWALIKKDTRYEIRRAARENPGYDLVGGTDEAVFQQFCDDYDEFAVRNNQPKLHRPWLALLAESGALSFSRTSIAGRETLTWHGYHRGESRATLLYSASLIPNGAGSSERNRLGRANRFQHWQDILRFKDEGLAVYDLGGWYEGQTNQKRLSINKFKEEFGGEIVRNYICEQALTWKGTLFLGLRRVLLGNAI